MKKSHIIKLSIGLLICVLNISIGSSQYNIISLEEAIKIARQNNKSLERDQLIASQKTLLAKAGMLKDKARVYFSGEEFDWHTSGVHSINLEQNFNLPKAGEAYRNYYESQARVAEKQVKLTANELDWEVSKAYYRIQYLIQEESILKESVAFYEDFLSKTRMKIESGETGKIPELAANSKLGQANLELEHNEEQYQVAMILFNSWLQSDSLFVAEGFLNSSSSIRLDSLKSKNAQLEWNQARIQMANAEIKRKESLLLPQISSGLKLQTASGEFPLFGYQIGLNIPLFKKAYKTHVEAAKVGLMIEEKSLEAKELKLQQTLNELTLRFDHQLHILEYIRDELTPIVLERNSLNFKAFEAGEIGYLESLDGMEDLIKVRQQQLDALYKFNLIRIELEYWLAN